jgi:hypothetical protein
MKILHNARIHTLDPRQPTASAIALEGECVIAVGGEDLITGFERGQCEDMRGRVILPGLTDAHIHLQECAMALSVINCEVDTKEEVLTRVRERAAQTPLGEWIFGHGWNQNNWEGGAWPTALDLEPVAPNHPVYLTAKSLHAVWANQRALQLAGITAASPDPENGSILRDRHGIPTGILLEDAVKLVEKAIPEPAPEDLAGIMSSRLIPSLWQMGLTGVHDFDKRTCFQALQLLHERGDLRLRVVKSIPKDLLPEAVSLGLRTGFGDDFLRIGSVKYFADGALGPHTGAMFAPYVDDSTNRGILTMDGKMLSEVGHRAVDCGLSLAVHAIGDRALHEVLDGFEQLRAYEREQGILPLRHRIEHVQTIHPEDGGRLADLDIIASMQPVHASSDMEMTERYLAERSAYCYAWRIQVDAGAHLAFGSDAPVEVPNPFLGLYAAVTRRRVDGSPGPDGWHPEQRLTFPEALAGFTTGAAYAAGMESRLGKLSSGYLADLIVLEQDPFTCNPSVLHEISPVATMVGGAWVWKKM